MGTRQRGGSEARNLWRAKACLRRKSVARVIMARARITMCLALQAATAFGRKEFVHPTPRLPLKVRGSMWQG